MDMKAGDSKPSTKADVDKAVDSLRRELGTRMGGFDQRMDGLDHKIDRVHKSLAKEIVRVQADLREVKANMATKDDVRKILTAVQDFAGKAEAFGRTATLHGQALTEVSVSLKDHDRRLRTLESQSASR